MENESSDEPTAWHFLVKDFYDYAENIETVFIHYAYAVHAASPEWATAGHVQSMPVVLRPSCSPDQNPSELRSRGVSTSAVVRQRSTTLKLPCQVINPHTHTPTNRYLLHYYFEIVQDGTRVKTAIYTEDIRTSSISAPSAPFRQAA